MTWHLLLMHFVKFNPSLVSVLTCFPKSMVGTTCSVQDPMRLVFRPLLALSGLRQTRFSPVVS